VQLARRAQLRADGRVGRAENQADDAENKPRGGHAFPRPVQTLDAKNQLNDRDRKPDDRKEPRNQAEQAKT
jgi:hypothetical protein